VALNLIWLVAAHCLKVVLLTFAVGVRTLRSASGLREAYVVFMQIDNKDCVKRELDEQFPNPRRCRGVASAANPSVWMKKTKPWGYSTRGTRHRAVGPRTCAVQDGGRTVQVVSRPYVPSIC
jgi:hypothetical protein